MRLEYPGKISGEKLREEIVPTKLSSKWHITLTPKGAAPSGKLLYGDNLSILRSLVEDSNVAGKVKAIYIDPPFATGRAFATRDGHLAYSDALVGHEFLEFLRRRLIFLRELLSGDGSIYVHIDSTIGHYVKVILDEVFGVSCFRSDISRIKCNPKNFDRKAYGNFKDTILFYSRNPASNSDDPLLWKDHRSPLTEKELEKQFPKLDLRGRRYATTPLHAPGETRNGPTGREWKGLLPPKGRHWRYSPDELTRLDEAGLIEWSNTGNPRKIIYSENNKGKKIQDVWEYKDRGAERATYPTEKNIDLLKFIVQNSTDPGDLVMDAFAGSGTTLLAANELGRPWIGLDASPLSMGVCQARLAESSLNEDIPVDFEVSAARVVPDELAKQVPMGYRTLEPASLLPEDLCVKVDSHETVSPSTDVATAILVDPDYRGSTPRFRRAFVPESGENFGEIALPEREVGEQMLVLMLHKNGKETIGLARSEQSVSR